MARRKPARKPQRKRRPKPKAKGGFGLPVLEQHHRDLIGLGLVAFAAFLAFVLYLGAAGGQVGEAVEDGLRFLMGDAAVLAPPALCAVGVVLVLHDSLPSVKPFRAGALCLLLGVTLGLAAGTLGPGARGALARPAAGPRLRQRPRRRARGAALRRLQPAVLRPGLAHHLPVPGHRRRAAADRGVHRRRRRPHARRGQRHHPGGQALHQRADRRAARAGARAAAHAPPGRPARAPGVEPVVHATHVEAPALDAESRYPDLFETDEGPTSPTGATSWTPPTSRSRRSSPRSRSCPTPSRRSPGSPPRRTPSPSRAS